MPSGTELLAPQGNSWLPDPARPYEALRELQREDATEMQSAIIAVLASAETRYISANCYYKS